MPGGEAVSLLVVFFRNYLEKSKYKYNYFPRSRSIIAHERLPEI